MNLSICVLLSWRLPVWTTIQHNCQAPRLGNGLLGSRDHLWRHHYWILPAAQHPNQDGSRVQEGGLKHDYTSSSAPRGKLDTLSHHCVFIFFLLGFFILQYFLCLTGHRHKWELREVEHFFFKNLF